MTTADINSGVSREELAQQTFEEAITRLLTEGSAEDTDFGRQTVSGELDENAIMAELAGAIKRSDEGRVWLLRNLLARMDEMKKSGQGAIINKVRQGVVDRVRMPLS